MTTLDQRHHNGERSGFGHGGERAPGPAEHPAGPAVLPLDHPGAASVAAAGSKAANLARAAGEGLPVLPGFVIPDGAGLDEVALRRAWDPLSRGGARPLVVRSSSPQEDTEASSLAGQFASVLDVRGWPAFVAAVRTVLDSARRADGSTAPMAVLVQPMLRARVGGVMFGADPVGGRTDRMLVSAVRGGPDTLVSGERAGTSHWVSPRGRLIGVDAPGDVGPDDGSHGGSGGSGGSGGPGSGGPDGGGVRLSRGELSRLARLARRARKVFGGPQDIEFGFDGEGQLWLFQSRPITAMAERPPRGARLLGPGPVAETLPGQLSPLEEDLWVAPMARGLAAALDIGGTAPRRLLRSVPVVTTVGGRAAADLALLGAAPPRRRRLALLNPAPGARRLGAAWRTGRLSSALPGLATDLVADVDRHLAEAGPPSAMSPAELAADIRWARRVLVSLHAQEALAGALSARQEPGRGRRAGRAGRNGKTEGAQPVGRSGRSGQERTAAGVALDALERARARGVPDARAVAENPVILALTAPSLRAEGPRLPEPPTRTPAPASAPAAPAPAPASASVVGSVAASASASAEDDGRRARGAEGASGAAPRQAYAVAGRRTAREGQDAPAAAPRLAFAGAGAAPSGTAPTRSVPVGPVSVDPATVGPATAGPASAGLASVGPRATAEATPEATPEAATTTGAGTGASTDGGGALAPVHAPAPRPDPGVLPPREALRLRVRWVQEFQVRLVREAARRAGLSTERVALLRWRELADVLHGGRLPEDLAARRPAEPSPPLPDAFRLTDDGTVVTERADDGHGGGMRGVSGGRAVGTVWDGEGPRPADPVLVVRTLDPALAPLLPGLTALVAQTGSPLSHLAVLAREYGLPAVVGAADAVRRFPVGSRLSVDGTAGDVRLGEAS